MLGLTAPSFEGKYLGFLNIESIAATEWITIIPSDFKDSRTGLAVPTGQSFANITVINVSNDTVYLRLRDGAVDDSSDGEVPLTPSAVLALPVQGQAGGALTSIQILKADVANEVQILASFNPISIV